MTEGYKYQNTPLKPKIAKEIILKQFSGKTVSRREIGEKVIQYHESRGGLLSTARTNPINAALRYLKEKGLAENISKGSGSTWRIFEKYKPVSELTNSQEFISIIRSEIQYLTKQIESFEHRKAELKTMLIEFDQ